MVCVVLFLKRKKTEEHSHIHHSKDIQQGNTQHYVMLFMGSTEETGNSHLPLIGYNSRTPPTSSPSPSNLRIVIWRRPVEEMKQVFGSGQFFLLVLRQISV